MVAGFCASRCSFICFKYGTRLEACPLVNAKHWHMQCTDIILLFYYTFMTTCHYARTIASKGRQPVDIKLCGFMKVSSNGIYNSCSFSVFDVKNLVFSFPPTTALHAVQHKLLKYADVHRFIHYDAECTTPPHITQDQTIYNL